MQRVSDLGTASDITIFWKREAASQSESSEPDQILALARSLGKLAARLAIANFNDHHSVAFPPKLDDEPAGNNPPL